MDESKKKATLAAIKTFAQQEKISSIKEAAAPYHWHIITWASFGIAATLFILAYLDVFQENRELKAALIERASPYKNSAFKNAGNDIGLREYVTEGEVLELPPTYNSTEIELPNLDYEPVEI